MKGASSEELGDPFFVFVPRWRNLRPLWVGRFPLRRSVVASRGIDHNDGIHLLGSE